MRISLGGIGYEMKIDTAVDWRGKVRWSWEIMRYGRPIGKGMEQTQKAAEKAGMDAFLVFSKKNTKRKNTTAGYRAKLRYYLDKRPYIVAHVTGYLMHGSGIELIIPDAKMAERQMWIETPPDLRVELPTHGLSASPKVMAVKVYETMRDLDYFEEIDKEKVKPNKRLTRFAYKVFGKGFADQRMENGVKLNAK